MAKVRICLDAGHSGERYNQSPVLPTYFESATMWKLHGYLKAELQERGFEVISTRENIQQQREVYQRGMMAQGCTVFLSLHSNACGTESVDYPVVYRAHDNLNNAEGIALQLAQLIGKTMGCQQAGRTAIRKDDSGGEYYGVLRGARDAGAPCYLLLEHSFHTNTAAAGWLSSDANLSKLAAAEASLLAANYGSKQPESQTAIMGTSLASAAQMAAYCRSKNSTPQLRGCSLDELALLFLEEGRAEGVRGDIAFAQSLKETGFFRYGGIVLPEQNNYAGIGALNGNAQGQAASFQTPRIGVRAQIQHLKAYASSLALAQNCVDPRFSLVARGLTPYVEWLGAADNPYGKGWAVPGKGYGAGILTLLQQILAVEVAPTPAPPEPAPELIPSWQREGLASLVKAGVVDSPEYWAAKLGESVSVGEMMGLLGKLLA